MQEKNNEPLIVNIDGVTKEISDYEMIVDHYPPGEYVNNAYISEFFGIRFPADDNWEFVSDEWLQKYSKQAQDKQTDLLLGSLEDIGGNPEAMRDWVYTLYLEVEMLACYNENQKTLGDVKFTMRDIWLDEDMTPAEFAAETAATLLSTAENVVCGQIHLCGKEYATVMGFLRGKNISMTLKFYYYKKGSMLCEILCRALPGREYVLDKFEKHLESYGDNSPK